MERERHSRAGSGEADSLQATERETSYLSERLGDLIPAQRSGVRKVVDSVLYREGEPAAHVFQLVSGGVVRLYKLMPDGRRQVTGFLYPGWWLGLSVHDEYVNTAETIGKCIVGIYGRGALERALEKDPNLACHLLGKTSEELRQAQEHMVLLGRKTATERIASFLIGSPGRTATDGSTQSTVYLPMPRRDIADYLGLTAETLSRTLHSLQEEKTIQVIRSHTVILLRLQRLRQLAEQEHTPRRRRDRRAERPANPASGDDVSRCGMET